MAKKIVKEVEIQVTGTGALDQAAASLNNLDQAVVKTTDDVEELGKESSTSLSGMKDKLSALPGPLGQIASGFKTALSGVKGMTLGMRGLAGAIAATGIGLLVVALGSLVAYFKNTEEGAQKLRVITAALGAAIGVVTDAAVALGKGLTQAFSGDFKGALSTVKQGFTDIGGEIKRDVEAAIALEKQMNGLKVAERNLNVERAETNKLVAQAKLDAKDLNLTAQERVDALKRGVALETELSEKEVKAAQDKLKVLEEQAKINSTDEATLQAIADQKAKVSEAETASLLKRTELSAQVNAFEQGFANEAKARVAERAAEEKKASEERIKQAEAEAKKKEDLEKQIADLRVSLISDDEGREIAALNLAAERRLEALTENSAEEIELRALIEEDLQMRLNEVRLRYQEEADAKALEDADKKKALLDKEVADAKAAEEEKKAARFAAADQALSAASSFTSAIQGLSNAIFANQLAGAKGNAKEEEEIRKKSFKANKALQIVNAVIGTAAAVVASAQLGFPAAIPGIIAAAALGAIQIATIAAAKYTPTGGSSGSRPSAPTMPAAPASSVPSAGNAVTPNVTFTGSGNNLNTVGGGANVQPQPIVIENNVNVSETEITGAQTTVAGYESAASLGG